MQELIRIVKTHPISNFVNCRNENLWYKAGDFEFPIPFEDLEGGIFEKEMDTTFLKRWIRKHLLFIQENATI